MRATAVHVTLVLTPPRTTAPATIHTPASAAAVPPLLSKTKHSSALACEKSAVAVFLKVIEDRGERREERGRGKRRGEREWSTAEIHSRAMSVPCQCVGRSSLMYHISIPYLSSLVLSLLLTFTYRRSLLNPTPSLGALGMVIGGGHPSDEKVLVSRRRQIMVSKKKRSCVRWYTLLVVRAGESERGAREGRSEGG